VKEMLEKLILVGNGGCMHEIAWQIERLNGEYSKWCIIGLVDKKPCIGYKNYPWLGDDNYLLSLTEDTNVAICIGSPIIRRKVAEKLSQNPYLHFPTIVLNQNNMNNFQWKNNKGRIAPTAKIGRGCILCMDSIVSTDVVIGKFVFLNIGSMVCHDSVIDDYVTLSPDVKLAGNVHIGQEAEIGIGARVIQGIRIGERTIIGAGAVVIRDIPVNCTAVGIPAKPIIKSV